MKKSSRDFNGFMNIKITLQFKLVIEPKGKVASYFPFQLEFFLCRSALYHNLHVDIY
jgi:hypothetical protein